MEYYEEETGKKEETPVRKKKTRRRKYRGGDIMFLLIAIAVFSVIIAFVVSRSKEKNNKTSASEDMAENVITYSEADMKTISAMARAEGRTEGEERLKDRIRIELTEGGKSVNDVVRGLYPEYLIYMEGGNYHFTPVKENLEKNPYRNTAFSVSDDGVLKLMVDGEETSKQVIDVSVHQGEIDWTAVYDSGVRYAMVRVGFRGYGSGALVIDEYFEKNIQNATAAGVQVGAYFFTQAVDEAEALEEADFVIEALKPYKLSLPVAIDVEKPEDSEARGNALSIDERTRAVCAFCDRIKAAGYEPMIYGGTVTFASMLDMEQIQDYPIWYAFYNNYLYYPYRLRFWQYSMKGSIPGIKGNVDMNIWLPENNG